MGDLMLDLNGDCGVCVECVVDAFDYIPDLLVSDCVEDAQQGVPSYCGLGYVCLQPCIARATAAFAIACWLAVMLGFDVGAALG